MLWHKKNSFNNTLAKGFCITRALISHSVNGKENSAHGIRMYMI